ncbi:MAG: hypothetical protein ABI579_09395 [Candidatus Sumerlaeota bacterium]
MKSPKLPGFPNGKVATVYSEQSGSWIGPVLDNEVADFRRSTRRFLKVLIIVVVGYVSASLLITGALNYAGFAKNLFAKSFAIIMVASVASGALAILRGIGREMRPAIVREVTNRKNRLFNPEAARSVIVSVKRSNRSIFFFYDDFALLGTVPGFLLLEGSRFLARIAASDLKLESASTGSEWLKITALVNGSIWETEIQVSIESVAGTIGGIGSAVRLWKEIYEGLLGLEESNVGAIDKNPSLVAT